MVFPDGVDEMIHGLTSLFQVVIMYFSEHHLGRSSSKILYFIGNVNERAS